MQNKAVKTLTPESVRKLVKQAQTLYDISEGNFSDFYFTTARLATQYILADPAAPIRQFMDPEDFSALALHCEHLHSLRETLREADK